MAPRTQNIRRTTFEADKNLIDEIKIVAIREHKHLKDKVNEILSNYITNELKKGKNGTK